MEKIVLYRIHWDRTNRYVYPPKVSGFRKEHRNVNTVIAVAESPKKANRYNRVCWDHIGVRLSVPWSFMLGNEVFGPRCLHVCMEFWILRDTGQRWHPAIQRASWCSTGWCAPSDALEQHYDDHGIVFAAVCGNILVCRRYLYRKRSTKQACTVPETWTRNLFHYVASSNPRPRNMSWHVRCHRLYEARYISYGHNIAGCTIPSVSHNKFFGCDFWKVSEFVKKCLPYTKTRALPSATSSAY